METRTLFFVPMGLGMVTSGLAGALPLADKAGLPQQVIIFF